MPIYLAIDEVPSVALPDGEIVGMSDSLAGLRAAGFTSPPYRNNRRQQVDETTSAWNQECIPGWYLVSGSVQQAKPLTALERKKAALRSLHVQLHVWADGLDEAARGQPIRRVNAGHQWLFYKHYAAYLIGSGLVNGATYTDDQIIAWAAASATGAADTQSVAQFYAAEPLTGDLADGPIGPMTWVNPATGVKVDLEDSIAIAAVSTVELDDVDLNAGAWIDALT